MSVAKCDCWRITSTLMDGEPLPDHICFESAVASVATWARAEGIRLAGVLRDTEHGLPGADIDSAKISEDDRHVLATIFDALELITDGVLTRWPFPYEELPVGIVIRQWAHEEPNRRLANQLADSCRWQHVVENYQVLYGIWMAQNEKREDEAIQEWLDRDGWSDSDAGIEGKDSTAASELLTHFNAMGLPRPVLMSIDRMPNTHNSETSRGHPGR